MRIPEEPIPVDEVKRIAAETFGNMIKAVVDFFYGTNQFGSSGILRRKYFDHFNYAARK